MKKKAQQKLEVDKVIVASLKKSKETLDEESELGQERKIREAQELIDEFNLNQLHEEITEGNLIRPTSKSISVVKIGTFF